SNRSAATGVADPVVQLPQWRRTATAPTAPHHAEGADPTRTPCPPDDVALTRVRRSGVRLDWQDALRTTFAQLSVCVLSPLLPETPFATKVIHDDGNRGSP